MSDLAELFARDPMKLNPGEDLYSDDDLAAIVAYCREWRAAHLTGAKKPPPTKITLDDLDV